MGGLAVQTVWPCYAQKGLRCDEKFSGVGIGRSLNFFPDLSSAAVIIATAGLEVTFVGAVVVTRFPKRISTLSVIVLITKAIRVVVANRAVIPIAIRIDLCRAIPVDCFVVASIPNPSLVIPIATAPPVSPAVPDVGSPPAIVRAGIPPRTAPHPSQGPVKPSSIADVDVDVFAGA